MGDVDINGTPIDPNYGREAIDGFTPEDPAAAGVALGLKPMDQPSAQALIDAVNATMVNGRVTGTSANDTVTQIVGLIAPFLTTFIKS